MAAGGAWSCASCDNGYTYHVTLDDAYRLAESDRRAFEEKIACQLGFTPMRQRGADGGIDGWRRLVGHPAPNGVGDAHALVQVKSGKVRIDHVRAFARVLDRDAAAVGVFVSFDPPTEKQRQECLRLGNWRDVQGEAWPRLQWVQVSTALREGIWAVHLPAAQHAL